MIETIPAWQIFFSPVIENWPIVAFFAIVAIIAAIVLIQRQTKTEEPLLEEIRQAKEQTKEREADLAALDEKYPYWIPGYGPAKFLRAKSDPCFHPCAGRLLYLYQTKSGMDIQIFTPPEMLARKGYEV